MKYSAQKLSYIFLGLSLLMVCIFPISHAKAASAQCFIESSSVDIKKVDCNGNPDFTKIWQSFGGTSDLGDSCYRITNNAQGIEQQPANSDACKQWQKGNNASTPIIFPKPSGLPQATADKDKIKTIVNITFSIFGAVALLIITIAGFRFVIHQGEPAEMAKQRNSIIYAVVGLVVALSAWAIVSFVVARI